MFVISDEIDIFYYRFGVYGGIDEKSMAGAKVLCQGFDGINEETRANDSSIFIIKRSTINLLDASTVIIYGQTRISLPKTLILSD